MIIFSHLLHLYLIHIAVNGAYMIAYDRALILLFWQVVPRSRSSALMNTWAINQLSTVTIYETYKNQLNVFRKWHCSD